MPSTIRYDTIRVVGGVNMPDREYIGNNIERLETIFEVGFMSQTRSTKDGVDNVIFERFEAFSLKDMYRIPSTS